MSTSINWTELIKDRKGVITKDNQSCGNIIGDDDENIIIEDGAVVNTFTEFQNQQQEPIMVLN